MGAFQPVVRPLDLGEPRAVDGEPRAPRAEADPDRVGLGRLAVALALGGVVGAAEGVFPRELGALERDRADDRREPKRLLPLAGAVGDGVDVDDGAAAGPHGEPDLGLPGAPAPGVA